MYNILYMTLAVVSVHFVMYGYVKIEKFPIYLNANCRNDKYPYIRVKYLRSTNFKQIYFNKIKH